MTGAAHSPSFGTAAKIAERLRLGIPPQPIFTRDIKPAGEQGFKVITNIGSTGSRGGQPSRYARPAQS